MELHLASMENVTCWAFRKLFLGATDTYTGILSLNYLLRKRNWKEVDLFQISGQRQWIQFATAKESECQRFVARLLRESKENPEKYNVYGLQLNLSCPSLKFTNIGQGPALIQRPKKVASMLRELLKQDRFKVSVKTRLGLGEEDMNQGKIFKLFSELESIEDPNFAHVAIHFKHARKPSYAPYDYSSLKRISEYKIPLVINGGINNHDDFMRIIKDIQNKKNIVGFMMGREALGNPDCFVVPSNILNKTNLAPRTQYEFKREFEDNCKQHLPKEIYVRTVKEYCPWAKNLAIEFPDKSGEQANSKAL